jgi:hypothetical protein
VRIKPPYSLEHPQLAGREEALVKLGIPAPGPYQVSQLFPNLADIRIQRNRWHRRGFGGPDKAMNSVARQGGVSKQQLYGMMEDFYG